MTGPVRSHVLVGHFEDVAAVMATARQAGRLVAVHSARELPGGWVKVVADLVDDPHQPPRGPWWRTALRAMAWGFALGLVAGLVWLLVRAVIAVVVWVSAHLGAIAAVVGVLVVLGLLRAGRPCEGMHCDGCRQ